MDLELHVRPPLEEEHSDWTEYLSSGLWTYFHQPPLHHARALLLKSKRDEKVGAEKTEEEQYHFSEHFFRASCYNLADLPWIFQSPICKK